MFRTVPLSIIRSFPLYTQQWYMSYRFSDSLRARCACSQAVSKPVWHIPLLCVQWNTPDDGQRNFPKHVEFHSKNKFEKLVHLVSFIIRNLSRFKVTWMSNVSIKLLNLDRLQCAGNIWKTSSDFTLHSSLSSVFTNVLCICKQVSLISLYPQLDTSRPLQSNRKFPDSTESNNSFRCLQYSNILLHPMPV